MNAGFPSATIAAATMNAITRMALIVLIIFRLRSEDVGDRAREPVSSVAKMGQRADSKQRASNAGRSLRNWSEGVIEEIVHFEDYCGGRGKIQTERGAGAVEVEVWNGAVESDYFISEDGSYITAVIELLG